MRQKLNNKYNSGTSYAIIAIDEYAQGHERYHDEEDRHALSAQTHAFFVNIRI